VDEELLFVERKEFIPYSISHIGQISWLPNLDSLTWLISEILPRLKVKEPRVRLFVYGAGDFSKIKIPREVKDNIEIIGFVDDIWQALSDKQILAVPLRIGSGIRIKILDMLAFGQPVITTSIGKEGINVFDGNQILIADTVDDFVKKIIKFFNNEYP
jgi:polysaccharide biosynthesis protein PslH